MILLFGLSDAQKSYKKDSTGWIQRRTEMFVWDLDSESRLKDTKVSVVSASTQVPDFDRV